MKRATEPASLTKRIVYGLAVVATAAGILCSHAGCGRDILVLPTAPGGDVNQNSNTISIGGGHPTPTPTPTSTPTPTVTP